MSPGDRMTKGLDFMLKGIGRKDKTPESDGTPQEAGVMTQESRVRSPETGISHQDPSTPSQESVVTTHESGKNIPEAGVKKDELGRQESRVTTHESGKDILEPGVTKDEQKSQESRVATQESRVESPETVIGPQDPSTLSQESRVTTHESGKNNPESGVTKEESPRQESGVMTQESSNLNQDSSVRPRETRPQSQVEKESGDESQVSGVVTEDIIEQAVAQAMKSPKISLYSPLLLAVLESQQLMLLNRKEMTLLQYRKATKARELVENALKETYPDLCEKIQERINEGNNKS